MSSHVLPRVPILGWSAFKGARQASIPSLLDAAHNVYTQSGRASIALALRLMRVQAGDQVLVPTYHCPTMIQPVVAAGAEPLFYPLDETGLPSARYLQALDTGRVRALLAAHYFGLPRPMEWLRRFCDERGIGLIEDCAHALFGRSDGRPIGSWGDYAIASLTKFFPVPEGGCLISHYHRLPEQALPRPSLFDEVKAAADAIEIGVRHNGFPGVNSLLTAVFGLKDALRRGSVSRSIGDGSACQSGSSALRNLALDAKQAARVTRWIAQHASRSPIVSLRRRNYAYLAQLLADIPGVRVLHKVLPEDAVPYVLPVLVDNPEAKYHQLRAAEVPVYRWEDVWPTTPRLRGDVGQLWARGVFQLGCHQDLSLENLQSIAQQVRRISGS